MSTTAVVTAIFGDYDKVKMVWPNDNVDYYLFTDNRDLVKYAANDSLWNPIAFYSNIDRHPRLAAKGPKLLTHRYLPGYSKYFWVDGSVQFHNSSSIDLMLEFAGDDDITMFNHPDRDCIYTESEVSLGMRKYFNCGIERQIAEYRRMQHPENWGLWASGIFVRKNTPIINNLFEFWMNENIIGSYQDQLSLPVSFRYFNIRPKEFNQFLWNNDWFSLHSHMGDH